MKPLPLLLGGLAVIVLLWICSGYYILSSVGNEDPQGRLTKADRDAEPLHIFDSNGAYLRIARWISNPTVRQRRDDVIASIENTPILSSCEQVWMVSRLWDQDFEHAVLDTIEQRNEHSIVHEFRPEEYSGIDYNIGVFKKGFFSNPGNTGTNAFELALTHIYHDKIRYLYDINHIRNEALRNVVVDSEAEWLVFLDFNDAVTEADVQKMESVLRRVRHIDAVVFTASDSPVRTDKPYLVDSFDDSEFNGHVDIEKVEDVVIAVRVGSKARFPEAVRYNRFHNSAFLSKPGTPWKDAMARRQKWETQKQELDGASLKILTIEGVLDLANQKQAHMPDHGDLDKSLRSFVQQVDAQRTEKIIGGRHSLMVMDEAKLEEERRSWQQAPSLWEGTAQVKALVEMADYGLSQGPYSVMDKLTADTAALNLIGGWDPLAPSGDPHDYYHPAPYYWPNPKTKDGLPFVRRDGERVPGTELYSKESDMFDRTRLQCMFDNTTTLSLAWYFTGDLRYAQHAARLVRTWFVDPDTRMNPHLKYSQVQRGANKNIGSQYGVIETKDFYFFLDGVRLLGRPGGPAGDLAEVWNEDDELALVKWLQEFLGFLKDSGQGKSESRSSNNHGTYYDLQVLAISSYVGDFITFNQRLVFARNRLPEQIRADGRQPLELDRTQSFHYCVFNLEGWANVARYAAKAGTNLWEYRAADGGSLKDAFSWLLPFYEHPWPYKQIEPFDKERLLPLYHSALLHFESTKKGGPIAPLHSAPGAYDMPAKFFPHDGIRPLCALGMS